MRSELVIAVVVVGLLLGTPAWAHHSFSAEFDVTRPVHFTGTVTKLELVNPHAFIYIDVKGSDGTVTNWAFELGSPNVLLRRGFTKNTIAIGTEVIVDGYQAKDGAFRANGRNMTLPNGQKLFLGAGGTGAPDDNDKSTKQ